MLISVVVEGDTDLPVARKLVSDAGMEIRTEIDSGGKGDLDRDYRAYNASATGIPWLILRDLDRDAACAPEFFRRRKIRTQKWMCYRIAVRELEAWLLADRDGFSRFFAVPFRLVPFAPDTIEDPSLEIVKLLRSSTSQQKRRAMIPAQGSAVAFGPLYEAELIEFGTDHWSLRRAIRGSDSLARAHSSLRQLAQAWKRHGRSRS